MDIKLQWESLRNFLQQRIGKKPQDVNAVLFLIGMQELGQGTKNFSKEQKQDLMHIATCKLLSYGGYYELEGYDEGGWPHWKSVRPIPHTSLKVQEDLLKAYAIKYFTDEIGVHL